jgi:alanyl-tRNA synthetase
MMESAEIARRFLGYFERRGHTVVPSASLVADDPTLLLVNAGMAPFKPYFLGQQAPPFRRATSAQKCVRTPDIEEVGKTTRHGTFFQMLGNFSFGDYFKDQAIPYAWELLTGPESRQGFGFPRIGCGSPSITTMTKRRRSGGTPWACRRTASSGAAWPTTGRWACQGHAGRVRRSTTTAGPSTAEGGPVVDEDRYLEVWNLVFMQYVRGEGPGKEGYPITGELPSKNIDTGMGLERMAALLQGVDNIYEIDTMWKVLDRAAELTEQKYGRDHRTDVALRVVADHVRTAVMLVADGVLPSNEARGYVLRRIVRRSIRNLRLLSARSAAGPAARIMRTGAARRALSARAVGGRDRSAGRPVSGAAP